MLFGLLVMSFGYSMARIVPGEKNLSGDETPSVAKSVEGFLKDWTRGQLYEPLSGGGERSHLGDSNGAFL